MEQQTRMCLQCKQEKDIKEGFRYTKRHKCYTRVCKECKTEQEKEARRQYKEKGLIKKKENVTITHKKCEECEEDKPIEQFYFHSASGYYMGVCKKCKNKDRRRKYSGLPEEQKDEFNKRRKEYYKKLEGRAGIVLHHCQQFDKQKGLECDVDLEYIQSSLIRGCLYCGFPSTGLDRIDTGIGHLKDNCVPCCRDCNVARSNHFTVDEMKIIGIGINEVKRARLDNREDVLRDYYHKGE